MLFFSRLLISVIFFAIIFPCRISAQQISHSEYIEKYKDIAIRQMNIYGIPASIILAQACIESGDGNSSLAVKGNNHFGIKCHEWGGDKIYQDDDAKNECFRKYKNAEESFKDHSEFLKTRPRYHSLFQLDRTDYKAWAYGLKAAGYATNPKYAQLLIAAIEKDGLHKYDLVYTDSNKPDKTKTGKIYDKNEEIIVINDSIEVVKPIVDEKKLQRMERRKARLEKREAKKNDKKSEDDFFNRY